MSIPVCRTPSPESAWFSHFANEDVEKEKFRKSNHNFLLSKDANYKCMGSFMGYNLFSRE